ncbi:MAG: YqgE/AlgH family protein [Janthinobacterium lividum]
MPSKDFDNLSGKILIASPYVLYEDIFHKSLIYMISHTENGSVGVIVNHPINQVPVKILLKAFNSNLADNTEETSVPIYLGGPIELDKAILLHSDDYDKKPLFQLQNNLAVSSNPKIIGDIIQGKGPSNSLFVVGYTVWKSGELETEIGNNFWIASECDQGLIFAQENDNKWQMALKKLGIENSQFSSLLGHC